MRVILQENIANLGKVGDQVTVKPGFARNFLIPKDKAVIATENNIKVFETRRAELEKAAADLISAAQQRAEKLGAVDVIIEAMASDEGKLYGSIGPREVADAVTAAGEAIEKSEITLPEGPIRNVGEYQVHAVLHSEVTAEIKVNVVAIKAE